jgi:hypothetical protein
MGTSAQYASTPVFGSASLTTADTSLTAPTTVGTVLSAGASGTRIDYIEIIGTGTSSVGLANIFVYDGANYRLWAQVPIAAITSSTTVPAFRAMLSSNGNADMLPLTLPTGYSLRFAISTSQANGILVNAYGGNF